MKFSVSEGILTITLPQRIDTATIAETEREVMKIIDDNPHESLVFDASELEYISSVGLRLVLKCKKGDDSLCVENLSSDVYDIFEMTGFTQILKVNKKFREISIAGCPLIGQGAYGKVYRLSPDSIVKSFYRGNPLSDIERERNLAKMAFVLGIPTAISYDVVKIKEEKLGSVYELIASDSLLDAFMKHPDKYDSYLNQYVKLLDQMGHTRVTSESIPNYKADLQTRLGHCRGLVKESLLKKIQAFIDELPNDNFLLHGDCHFKNIFVTPDGLMLIDMDTLSKGDPIYEIACLYKTYVTFDTLDPGNSKRFFGVEENFCIKLFDDVFEGLYKNNPHKEDIRAKVEALGWFLYLSHICNKPEEHAVWIDKAIHILKKKFHDVD